VGDMTRSRRCAWLAGGVLPLFLFLLVACGGRRTPGVTPTTAALEVQTPTPTRGVPTRPAPTPTPTPLATPAAVLPAVVSPPAPAPTPFPDAQEIVYAVLGIEAGKHWASHQASGSITAPGADEQVALVGNIGDYNEVRWVVIGQVDDEWQLRGTSEWLGSGFDAPPSFYVPPDLLDFDDDGQQDLLVHYANAEWGWNTAADTIYHWDGQGLVPVWGAPTRVDNRAADSKSVSQPYREDYQAEWEWVNLDGRYGDEILLRERVTFYLPDEQGVVPDGAPSVGEEAGERAFRWDGQAFQPYAPDGPAGSFAYAAADDLWLWQQYRARPLGVGLAQDVYWSPDGQHVAWWAEPPAENPARGVVLGVYDLATGTQREFLLGGVPSVVRWTPDGRLAYTIPGRLPALLDLMTGQQEPFPVVALGAWSPDGSRMAYERDGSLYVYDFSTGQDQALALAPAGEESATLAVHPDLAWSPRGDWIACTLGSPRLTWMGLVAPDLPRPLSALDLLETFNGLQAAGLQFAWSPDGARLAALTTDPQSAQQPAVLYLADLFSGQEGGGVGRPEWKQVLRLEPVSGTVRLAWSPNGERLALAAGAEIWEVTARGEPALRRRFAFPEPRWTALEWAPDGSGLLAGLESAYDGRFYWLPADGAEPALLLADAIGAAQWAPLGVEVHAHPVQANQPPMVLVEHAADRSLIHFVSTDGTDVVVRARGADRYTPFQAGGPRVYYYTYYADQNGVVALPGSGALGGCHPPLPSADGARLAWLCDDGLPDLSEMISGTAEIHFWVIVTDGAGREPRQVWDYVERGPDYRAVHLLNWRADDTALYLSRPKYGVAWAYFGYNPGILALDVATGQTAQVGDLEGIHDGLVSPDGAWLVQSRIAESPDQGAPRPVSILLRSLVDGTERSFPCTAGVAAAGDFSFSPENHWLAWREWAPGAEEATLLVRALGIPDGEPFTVYQDAEPKAPRIGGWLTRDDLVMVVPLAEDGADGIHPAGGYSTLLTLPATGPGGFLSPYSFLGVWAGTP